MPPNFFELFSNFSQIFTFMENYDRTIIIVWPKKSESGPIATDFKSMVFNCELTLLGCHAPKEVSSAVICILYIFRNKKLTSLPKTLKNGQFWRPWKWIWGPTKKRSFTTAVLSATEINALFNVKSILTENSIQRLRWTKMNKMNVFSRRVLATPTSSNSPALACVNAHTHAPCVHRTIVV